MTAVCIPVFDGNHYECWSVKMKTLLKSIGLWDVVETGVQQELPVGTYDSPSSAEYYSAQWKQWLLMKDTTALYILQNSLTNEIFPWIASARSSKEAWKLLLVKTIGGPMFQTRKLIDLKKQYEDVTMSDSETIHEFTKKLMEHVFLMKSCGWEVEDKEVVKKILSSLPPRFDKVLKEVAKTLSLCEVIDCLLVHEYNMRPVKESLKESVIESVVDVEEEEEEEVERSYSLNEKIPFEMELFLMFLFLGSLICILFV